MAIALWLASGIPSGFFAVKFFVSHVVQLGDGVRLQNKRHRLDPIWRRRAVLRIDRRLAASDHRTMTNRAVILGLTQADEARYNRRQIAAV